MPPGRRRSQACGLAAHLGRLEATLERTQRGPHSEIDRSYGVLATYVADHALGIEGPIREYYLVDRHTTIDPSQGRTQIGWPIFQTALPTRTQLPRQTL